MMIVLLLVRHTGVSGDTLTRRKCFTERSFSQKLLAPD